MKKNIILILLFCTLCGCVGNNNYLYQIVIDNKIGYMDKNGAVIIKPVYDYYLYPQFDWFRYNESDIPYNRLLFSKIPRFNYGDPFAEDIAIVKYNGKWGFINTEGKIVAEAKYDEAFPFRNRRAAIRVGDKWGYIDKNGEMLIKPEYEEALYFFEDRAWVKKNGKYGFIDNYGNVILPVKYDFYHEDMRSLPFRKYYGFRDGLACVGINNKFGYVNTKGEFVVKPVYDYLSDFQNGYATVYLNGLAGIINTRGEYIIKPVHRSIFYGYNFSDDNPAAFVDNAEEGIGFINKDYKVIVKPQFSRAFWFSEGMAGVAKKIDGKDKWGYINNKGELVVKPLYKENSGEVYNVFRDGAAIVSIEEYDEKGYYKRTLYGCIDKNGKYIIPISDKVIKAFYGDVAVFRDSNKKLPCGLIDTNARVIVEPKFNYIGPFIDGIAKVIVWGGENKTKFGYINKKGEYVWKLTN